ncbi:CRISPR-associated endoribonuclease Cas6 [Moorellaceae bacterium AZ2]
MRVRVRLRTETGRTFFLPHEQVCQGLTLLVYEVFKAGNPDFASWLHDMGWQQPGTPRYKLFAYSRLYTDMMHINDKGIFFGNPDVSFFLSSPDPQVISVFLAGTAMVNELAIGDTRFKITGIDRLVPPKTVNGWLDVITLSPCVISDSLTMPSQPYRYLLLDREPDLACSRLEKNARLKWMCYGRDAREFYLRIALLSAKPKLVYHAAANHAFPCSEAIMRLEGPPEVLEFVYDTGLGEKTGMGFGCLGLYRKKGDGV